MVTASQVITELGSGWNPDRTVLLLAYNFPPANASGAARPFRFAKYLPRQGYRPEIVTATSDGSALGWSNVHLAPGAQGAAAATAWASDLIGLVQTYSLPYNDLLPWIPHCITQAERVIKRSSVEVILSTSPPVATHLAALYLKRRYGLPWIADFRDPLYGNPFRNRRFGKSYDAALERLILSSADAIVTNTDTAGETFRKRYAKQASRISVIWNGFDPDDSMPAAVPEERGVKVIRHVGSIYRGRHPGLLVASLDRLLSRGMIPPDSIRLDLVGPIGPWRPWTEEASFESLLQKGCLTLTDARVAEMEARKSMANADYLLLLDLNANNESLQVPAKLFDYIRIGRPILNFSPDRSPTSRILARSGIPHASIHPGEPSSAIDAKVLSFLQCPSTVTPASEWFEKEFAAPAQVGALANILDNALRGRSSVTRA